MKVLQINAVDAIGSTGTIMSDIQDVCTHNGIECHIAYAVTQRSKHDILNGYHIGNWFDHKFHALLSRIFRKQAYFSTIPTRLLLRHIGKIKPDVVHLHNLHSNYINLNMLLRYLAKNDIATVATLHDNWFFTGECYLPELIQCRKWETGCKGCPLHAKGILRLTKNTPAKVLSKRKQLWTAIPRLTVVSVSDWMTGEAKKSFFSKASIVTIRNGVRMDVFTPMPEDARKEIRSKYGIGDNDFAILAPASKWLAARNAQGLQTVVKNLQPEDKLVLYGCTKKQLAKAIRQKNIIYIPFIANKVLLSTIYSMADVMINCTHMDTCSFINIEAQACGTPVITFDNTGAAETVDGECGFCVATDKYDVFVCEIAAMRQLVIESEKTRRWVNERFSMVRNYRYYLEIYENPCIFSSLA